MQQGFLRDSYSYKRNTSHNSFVNGKVLPFNKQKLDTDKKEKTFSKKKVYHCDVDERSNPSAESSVQELSLLSIMMISVTIVYHWWEQACCM